MSEPPSNSTQLNDINGSGFTGTFTGDIHVVATGPEVDALTQKLLRDYGAPGAMIRAVLALQQEFAADRNALRQEFAADRVDRLKRQSETDAYRALNERRLERIEAAVGRSLWASAAALLAAAASWIRGREN